MVVLGGKRDYMVSFARFTESKPFLSILETRLIISYIWQFWVENTILKSFITYNVIKYLTSESWII